MVYSDKKTIQKILKDMGEESPEKYLVDIDFVSPEEIQKLNQEHRQIDKPTDVLSFPTYTYQELQDIPPQRDPAKGGGKLPTESILLGSLVLCEPVIRERAKDEQTNYEERLDWSVRHGLKHLLGYDHDETGEHWHPITS